MKTVAPEKEGLMDPVKDFVLISNALWEEGADLEKALRDFSGLDMSTRLRIFGGVVLQGTLPYEDDKRRLLGLLCQRLEGTTPQYTRNLHHIGKRVVEAVGRGRPHFRRREFWMGLVTRLTAVPLPDTPNDTRVAEAIERMNALNGLDAIRQGLPLGSTYIE